MNTQPFDTRGKITPVQQELQNMYVLKDIDNKMWFITQSAGLRAKKNRQWFLRYVKFHVILLIVCAFSFS
jgi:hypothetical protein